MEQNIKQKNIKKHTRLYLIIALLFLMVSYYLFLVSQETREPYTTLTETDSQPVYSLKSRMKLLSFFPTIKKAAFTGRATEKDYGTYVVPGLNGTRTQIFGEKESCDMCTSMTPQGLAVTENYLLVSAYCYTGTHNSVIYMIDKSTHKFIKEIVLSNKAHVGGMAYDPVHHNVWITGMSHGTPQVHAISLAALKRYSFSDGYHPITYSQTYDLYAITRSSFLTWYNNSLYVGYFTHNSSSVLEEYKILDDGSLKTETTSKSVGGRSIHSPIALPADTTVISDRAQGVAFYKGKLLFSHSYGVYPSTIHVYEDTVKKLLEKSDAVTMFYLPEKLEQIYVDEDDLYILFESASHAYQSRSIFKMDRILKLNLDILLK